MRTGIFGGSFNPVHNGHINLAKSAVRELSLDRVIFVPSKIPPHRSADEYISGGDRLEMLKIACKGEEKFQVSDYELKNDRVSYTVFTVEYFRSLYPDDKFFLLTGSDMLLSFDTWFRYKEILGSVSLAVFSREEGDRRKLEEKAEKLSEYGEIYISDAVPFVISSTEIRKKIEKNQNISCYLDENVVEYIRSKRLYRREDPGEVE